MECMVHDNNEDDEWRGVVRNGDPDSNDGGNHNVSNTDDDNLNHDDDDDNDGGGIDYDDER